MCADQSPLRLIRPSASDSGPLVDLAPAAQQRLSDLVQSLLLVAIFVPLITNHVLRRPPITGSERLVPAAVAELGRRDIGVLYAEVRREPWRHAHYPQL